MDHLQIELLYRQYGWSAAQIATAINKQLSYVQLVIREHGWEQGDGNADTQSSTDISTQAQPTTNGQAVAIQALKDKEISKQTVLAPLIAVAEMSLLGKLSEAIDHVDVTESDSHIKLTNLVKAFKHLTQDSVTSKVVSDENNKPGIAIQVITQIV